MNAKELFTLITGVGATNDSENSTVTKKNKKKKTTVSDTIPYIRECHNGILEISPGTYCKSYSFTDINYLTSEEESQERILTVYRDFINYFNPNMLGSLTLFNHLVDNKNEEKKLLIPLEDGDRLDKYRNEFNTYLLKNFRTGRNNIVQEKMFTVAMEAKNEDVAIKRFEKLDRNLVLNLEKTGTKCTVMSMEDKLSQLHHFFRPGKEGKLKIDWKSIKKSGVTAKEYICPSCFEFQKDYFVVGETYWKAMYITNFSENLVDTFMQEINDFDFPMVTTLTFKALNKKKAGDMLRRQHTSMEKEKFDKQKKNSAEGVDPEMLPYDLRHSIEEAEQMIEDTTKRNEKVFYTSLTLLISGKDKEELENNVSEVSDIVEQHVCDLLCLSYLQEEGMCQTLPFAHDLLGIKRTLTSSSVAVFTPFMTQECNHENGITYGKNAISKRTIRVNKSVLKNRNGFVLGKPGSGKSFFKKEKDTEEKLRYPTDTIIIIDPEGEYVDWAIDMGGQVIEISPTSQNRINPCDCDENYGIDEDGRQVSPVNFKADYLLSLFQAMINGNSKKSVPLDPVIQGFLDTAIRKAYEPYEAHNYDKAYLPTMTTIKNILKENPDNRAQDLATMLEYYVGGSANLFSDETEIDINNKLLVFNLLNVPKQIKTLAYVIVMDQVWNLLVSNWNTGSRTIVDIDEISILFKNDLVGEILQEYWRRARKWGGEFTGMTQNFEEVKKSEIAVTMISNSEFVALLGQSENDMDILEDIFDLSENQSEYLLSATTGSGILIIKEDAKKLIIPFEDNFPKDTELYKLMTSKMEEVKQRKEFRKKQALARLMEKQAEEIVEFEETEQ